MKRLFVSGSLILALVLAISAWAQPPQKPAPGRLQETLKQADKNGDGNVTLEELKAVRPNVSEEQFKKWDRNKDGVISKADKPTPEEVVAGIIKQADKDGNGKVTFEELKAVRPKLTQEQFNRMDRNKDGVICKADAVPPREPAANLLKKADTNGDGKVTLDELKAVAPKMTPERFAKMDRNSDGVLTKEDAPFGPGPGAGPGAGRGHGHGPKPGPKPAPAKP